MLKFDLRVELGRVNSGAKIAVSAFKPAVIEKNHVISLIPHSNIMD